MTCRPVDAASPAAMRLMRYCLALLLPAVLAACADTTPPHEPAMPVMEEQANYQAHARSHYTPPGPAGDPWGPYINEAANRFDVPAEWIRAVMHQESGGHLYDASGQFITSTPGAMGLMQIMPPAYDDLRAKYGLGPDPYDPRDNILAGTAYIRQMYEIYGSPGFLAAYNYGPGSLDHYLRQNRALPRETRNYVAAIAPKIIGIWPRQRSRNDLIVARHDRTARLPRPAGPSAGTGSSVAEQAVRTAENQDISAAWASRGFSPSPAQPVAPARPEAAAPAQNGRQGNPGSEQEGRKGDGILHIRSIPLGDAPMHHDRATDMPGEFSHDWAIQLGSYGGQKQARMVATELRPRISTVTRSAVIRVMRVHAGRITLYRARLANMTHGQANAACQRLKGAIACVTVPPDPRF